MIVGEAGDNSLRIVRGFPHEPDMTDIGGVNMGRMLGIGLGENDEKKHLSK